MKVKTPGTDYIPNHLKSNGSMRTEKDNVHDNQGVLEEMMENGSSNCLLPGKRLFKDWRFFFSFPCSSHSGGVADDSDCAVNCLEEGQINFFAPSFRYVEDEAPEWSELDYKLKVSPDQSKQFGNLFLRLATLQQASLSFYCSGVVVSFHFIICLIRWDFSWNWNITFIIIIWRDRTLIIFYGSPTRIKLWVHTKCWLLVLPGSGFIV